MVDPPRAFAVVAAFAGAALLAAAPSSRPALAHSDGHGTHDHRAAREFPAGEPGSGEPVRVIEIVMHEGDGGMAYSPSHIEVRKGDLVRFVLKNAGRLRHEMLIDSFENNAEHKALMEKSPDMQHAEPNGRHVEPGKSAELLWRFTRAGTFEYACLIPGHYESGMRGVIIVK